MKISAFTFLRNGSKLHYPILESIQSALPLVDEYVIALGDSDADDTTRLEIEGLRSGKIILFDTVWNLEKFPGGTEYAHQTDLAKQRCTGDWLLYLQGDEVLHEDDLPQIRKQCEKYWTDERVEGMIFDYLHFWGNYDHVHKSHAWYKQEIRMLRNLPDIHSRNDAQSFRRVPNFDGVSYRQKEGTKKLCCVHSGARIFHYGWVRPPQLMEQKRNHFDAWHRAKKSLGMELGLATTLFDYGPLKEIPPFSGSHPAVMLERIKQMDWQADLYEKTPPGHRPARHKHARLKYRLLSWLENTFFSGRHLFGSKHFFLHRD